MSRFRRLAAGFARQCNRTHIADVDDFMQEGELAVLTHPGSLNPFFSAKAGMIDLYRRFYPRSDRVFCCETCEHLERQARRMTYTYNETREADEGNGADNGDYRKNQEWEWPELEWQNRAGDDPAEVYEAMETQQLFNELRGNEKKIVRLRAQGYTLQEVGKRLHVTEARVQQIKKKIRERLSSSLDIGERNEYRTSIGSETKKGWKRGKEHRRRSKRRTAANDAHAPATH